MEDLTQINLLVDVNNLEESLFKIYKQLRPLSEKTKTIFKELKGGFVNLTYILYSENEIEKAIVFRTFGTKFDDKNIIKANEEMKSLNSSCENSKEDTKKEINSVFFDRSFEASLMQILSKYNLCKPVYAKYLNGMCFGFATGINPFGPLMLTNDYLIEMSTKLAKFHSLKIQKPGEVFETHFDKFEQQFGPSMKPLADFVENEMKKVKDFPYNIYPDQNQLIQEDENLKSKFENIGMGEIAFCHNDLNQKNIIWNSQQREISFIDLEMSMNNYIANELATVFLSFCGHFLEDFKEDFLPNENYRLKFIRRYLEERYKIENKKLENDTFEKEVKLLFIRSNIFLLILMTKFLQMIPFFDFKPDVFKIDESIRKKKSSPYFCGEYGLKMRNVYLNIKDKLLKSVDEYF